MEKETDGDRVYAEHLYSKFSKMCANVTINPVDSSSNSGKTSSSKQSSESLGGEIAVEESSDQQVTAADVNVVEQALEIKDLHIEPPPPLESSTPKIKNQLSRKKHFSMPESTTTKGVNTSKPSANDKPTPGCSHWPSSLEKVTSTAVQIQNVSSSSSNDDDDDTKQLKSDLKLNEEEYLLKEIKLEISMEKAKFQLDAEIEIEMAGLIEKYKEKKEAVIHMFELEKKKLRAELKVNRINLKRKLETKQKLEKAKRSKKSQNNKTKK